MRNTKGPWKSCMRTINTDTCFVIISEGGYFIAEVGHGATSDSENYHNAKLISITPELAEVVIGLFSYVKQFSELSENDPLYKQADKLISIINHE